MKTLQDLEQLFAGRNASEIAGMIYGFSGFRTSSIDELTEVEKEKLYQVYAPKSTNIELEYNALKVDLIKKEWKSKILALAEKTNIKEKGSFHNFNNWMMVSSKFKKHLNAHSIDEVKELYKQLRGVQHNNARSAKNTMTKAWWRKADELKQFN